MSNTFLHGDLEVVVLMEIPSGFDGRIRPSNVCRLKKALYGFKQSRRAWLGDTQKLCYKCDIYIAKGCILCFLNIPREVM